MNAEMNTQNKFSRELQISCECGCGKGYRISLESDGDGGWISSTEASFSGRQYCFRDRLRAAWEIVRHGEYIFHDALLTNDDLKAVRDFIDGVRKYRETKK